MENIDVSNKRFRYLKSIYPYIIYFDNMCSSAVPFVLVKCDDLERNNFELNNNSDLFTLHARLYSSLKDAEQNSTQKLHKRRNSNESKCIIRK